MKHLLAIAFLIVSAISSCAQSAGGLSQQYKKIERMVPMRDGVKLFTAVYVPIDTEEKYPFLLERTPYSCYPYGEANFPRRLGPGALFANEKYIYVFQDVRGRYKSEGNFEEMTPHEGNKKTGSVTNESTDCFDTIDWLLKNIENNNGKAGISGISYPGFYATAALPNAHPALKAASPQAPVTDEFEGDDAYHRGAFFLMDNFSFINSFDYPRDTPWTQYPQIFKKNITDAYDFYLGLGPLKNANEEYYKNKSKIWNEYLQHDTKDAYWQARDIRTHLNNIKPAVLVVGGWFDAEDLFGSLTTYKTLQNKSNTNSNSLIMGPWTHGSWSRSDWSKYATLGFGGNTSQYFQQLEFNFFNYYLKGKGTPPAPGATIFQTGSNQWKEYKTWPPAAAKQVSWYLTGNKQLSFTKPAKAKGFDEYVSDPANPVPYMNTNSGGRNNEYMAADQSFAAKRKDVLVYESDILAKNTTLSGPVTASLFVSNSATDADFVVKIIDVLPDTATDNTGKNIGGMQRLVRAEILRGKFRNSFVTPLAFTPNKITSVEFALNDVAHSFLKGHRIMIQVQSSWFPLADRNPQKFMRIPDANESDFQKATIRIYHDEKHPSVIKVWQTE